MILSLVKGESDNFRPGACGLGGEKNKNCVSASN